MPCFAYFQIETAARVHYVLVLSESVLRSWILVFRNLFFNLSLSALPAELDIYADIVRGSDPSKRRAEEDGDSCDKFLCRPVDWMAGGLQVYNYRRIHFRAPAHSHDDSTQYYSETVELTLRKAFSLEACEVPDVPVSSTSPAKFIQFLDSVSLFQVSNNSKHYVCSSFVAISQSTRASLSITLSPF